MNRIAETAVVYPGVELGEDVVIGDYAVVGKQPVLGKRSTASRGELPPLVIGDGSAILAGAVVFAGTTLGVEDTVAGVTSLFLDGARLTAKATSSRE